MHEVHTKTRDVVSIRGESVGDPVARRWGVGLPCKQEGECEPWGASVCRAKRMENCTDSNELAESGSALIVQSLKAYEVDLERLIRKSARGRNVEG